MTVGLSNLYSASNVVVGAAMLYYCPWLTPTATPPPSADSKSSAFDTTAFTSPWVATGGTDQGYKVTGTVNRQSITIEEQALAVASKILTRTLSIQAALAEDTMKNMQLAWGGDTITTVAAASGISGKDTMLLTDVDQFFTICLETQNLYGLARRIYIPKCTVSGSGDTNFRRAADKRMYAVQFDTLCKPSDIQIVDIKAVALP